MSSMKDHGVLGSGVPIEYGGMLYNICTCIN